MPNHTTNIMYVSGPRADLEKFRDTVSGNNPVIVAALKTTLEANIAKNLAILKDNPTQPFAAREVANDTKTLDEIAKGTYEGKALDFNGTVPMPASMHITSPAQTDEEKRIAADNLAKYGCESWYDWACKYWGTKWGAYEVEDVEDLQDQLIYRYQTAWSPPSAWIVKTSELFPTLSFRIAAADEGGGFYLDATFKEGEVVEEKEMECHDWRMEFDPSYAEIYSSIFSVGYEEGIKTAIEMGHIEYSLEEELLKFIQDEDLPLFVNFEWETDAGELYSERVKSLDKEKSEKEHAAKKRAKKKLANG